MGLERFSEAISSYYSGEARRATPRKALRESIASGHLAEHSFAVQLAYLRLIGVGLVPLVQGCGVASRAELGWHAQAIENGQVDTEHHSVFRVVTRNGGYNGLCSSTLIASNLLLTARHCVAPVSEHDGIDCAETAFGATIAPSELLFSNDTEPGLTSEWFEAARVLVDEGQTLLCGNDIALVILQQHVPARVAVPTAPRLSPAVASSEAYVAVGYGADSAGDAAEYGVRHFRDALEVYCTGAACDSASGSVTQQEFVGAEGVCRGDSGGPALDAAGQVIGALSRGREECESPVYTSVPAFRHWLVAGAQLAAELGEGPLAVWAGGPAVEPAESSSDAGSGANLEPSPAERTSRLATEQGCGIARPAQSSGLLVWVLGLALAALGRRSR